MFNMLKKDIFSKKFSFLLTLQKLLCYNQLVAGEKRMEEYPSLVEGTGLENRKVV